MQIALGVSSTLNYPFIRSIEDQSLSTPNACARIGNIFKYIIIELIFGGRNVKVVYNAGIVEKWVFQLNNEISLVVF